ncbi:hypothetical protein DFH09DRAFT_1321967 [Mycena vulgaris]|nr:hypothetical protein DFH09DRAFT_1321967 [Mycena vulgaris]
MPPAGARAHPSRRAVLQLMGCILLPASLSGYPRADYPILRRGSAGAPNSCPSIESCAPLEHRLLGTLLARRAHPPTLPLLRKDNALLSPIPPPQKADLHAPRSSSPRTARHRCRQEVRYSAQHVSYDAAKRTARGLGPHSCRDAHSQAQIYHRRVSPPIWRAYRASPLPLPLPLQCPRRRKRQARSSSSTSAVIWQREFRAYPALLTQRQLADLRKKVADLLLSPPLPSRHPQTRDVLRRMHTLHAFSLSPSASQIRRKYASGQLRAQPTNGPHAHAPSLPFSPPLPPPRPRPTHFLLLLRLCARALLARGLAHILAPHPTMVLRARSCHRIRLRPHANAALASVSPHPQAKAQSWRCSDLPPIPCTPPSSSARPHPHPGSTPSRDAGMQGRGCIRTHPTTCSPAVVRLRARRGAAGEA